MHREGKGERSFIKQPLGPMCRAGLAKKNFFPSPSASERAVIPSHTSTWGREMLQAKHVEGEQQAALRRAGGLRRGRDGGTRWGAAIRFLGRGRRGMGRSSQSGEALSESLLLILSFPYFEVFLWLFSS